MLQRSYCAPAEHHSSRGQHHVRQAALHSLQAWAILSRALPKCEDWGSASEAVDLGMP